MCPAVCQDSLNTQCLETYHWVSNILFDYENINKDESSGKAEQQQQQKRL